MRQDSRHIEFEELLRRSHSIISHVCVAFSNRSPLGFDDLYQEIACNLWRGWPSFHGESEWTTWVYRVAINTVGMEVRHAKRRKELSFVPLDDSFLVSLADEAKDPQVELLYSLIDRLPDGEKKLIFLHLDGLSNAEIAAVMDSTEPAVKQKLYRIKNKLKKINTDYYEQ